MEKIKRFLKRVRNIIGPFGFVSSFSAIIIIIATAIFAKAGYAPEKAASMMIFVFICSNVLGILIISFLFFSKINCRHFSSYLIQLFFQYNLHFLLRNLQ